MGQHGVALMRCDNCDNRIDLDVDHYYTVKEHWPLVGAYQTRAYCCFYCLREAYGDE